MRRSTTRPAPPPARAKRDTPAAGGIGSHRRHGHLPRLRAGRALRLAAEDAAHQFLRLRLRLLREPRRPNVQRARFTVRDWSGSPSTSTGATTSKACSSPPASSAPPTTRWSSWSRWRGAARGARLPRLHPPEDHPRSRRPSCSPRPGRYADRLSHQHRDAARAGPDAARAREEPAGASAAPWRDCAGHRGGRKEATQARCRPPRFAPAGPEHADDRRRRRCRRPRRSSPRSAKLYGATA